MPHHTHPLDPDTAAAIPDSDTLLFIAGYARELAEQLEELAMTVETVDVEDLDNDEWGELNSALCALAECQIDFSAELSNVPDGLQMWPGEES